MNKRLYIISLALLSCLPAISARETVVKACDVSRADGILSINMLMATPDGLPSNREVTITPVLRSEEGRDSLLLEPLTIAGRSRYYQDLRAGKDKVTGITRASKDLEIPYSTSVSFEPWMEHSSIDLRIKTRGCCGNSEETSAKPLAALDYRPRVFTPVYSYNTASTGDTVKTRSLSGRAYIDFPVNITAIRPAYRNNMTELAKIDATIDSVKLDRDITINTLSIKGYASPEGSYANNERLAKGRTISLSDYVRKLHKFAPGLMKTSWEAEDWTGLRQWVGNSDIEGRSEILAIIDSDIAPDAREAKIKSRFPAQYRMLLTEVYPALRHSDYTIDYTIRTYTDPAEIRALVTSAPQKLSLDEFSLAAKTIPQDSPEYRDLWLTAAKVYPGSEIANLNAANAAMASGDLSRAASCLDRAGDSGEAIYARGNLAALSGDLSKARELLTRAAKLKVADAPAALERLEKITAADPVTIFVK